MKPSTLLATVGILLLLAVPTAVAFRPEDYALKYGGFEDRYARAATTFQVVSNIRLQVGLAHAVDRFNQYSRVLGTTHRTHNLLTGNAILDNNVPLLVQTYTSSGRIDFEPQSSEGWVSFADLMDGDAWVELTPVEGGEPRKIYRTEIVKILSGVA